MAKKALTQNDQRRWIAPIDQFGRQWSMQIEVLTGDPTGGINGGNGPTWPYGDPLRTPQQYVELERQGPSSDIGRCQVRFDRWIAAIEADEDLWLQNRNEIVAAKFPVIPEDLDHNPLLIKFTGPKPWPSSDVLRQARDGYAPFLGQAPLSAADRVALVRPTLRDLQRGPAVPETDGPPETYKEFVGWAMRGGHAKNLTEAAKLWKEHQQLLAEV